MTPGDININKIADGHTNTKSLKSLPIFLTSLLLGLGFDWLFVGKLPGISVLIYSSLVLGFTLYLTRQYRSHINKSVYLLAPAVIFFSLMVFVRGNLFLAFMNISLVIYLLMLVARLAHQPKIKLGQYELLQYFKLLFSTPVRFVGEFFQVLLRSISNRNTSKVPASTYAPVMRGLLLSLPVLGLFLLLLSSADLVFKGYVSSLIDLNVSAETVFRWILIGFVTSLFTGAYAYIFMPSSRAEVNPTPDHRKFSLGTTESSIILGSVGLLFFVFVMIQLAYLFGGSGQVISTGYTYAEYARKGFFELIAVAAISLFLILAIKNSNKSRTFSQAQKFKWLSGVLIIEVLVIMLSAHMRLNLYEEAYGFTILRLFSHLFILWLAFAFAILIFHIIRGTAGNNFTHQLFISVLCFFALINLINPDNFIARQNINRFNRVGKIDLQYLGNLSDDAVPAIAQLVDHPHKGMQKGAANILHQQKQSRGNNFNDWQSKNLARARADKIFRDKAKQIETGESYSEGPELVIR